VISFSSSSGALVLGVTGAVLPLLVLLAWAGFASSF